MSKNKKLLIDQHLARDLSGADKVRALMAAKGGSVSRWAVNHGLIPEQVFMTLSARRPYPEIRAMIAADLELTIDEVDRLLGDGKAVAA